MRRHVGLLVVHVMEGRDLKKMDAFGKADPFLELYTQPTCVEKTVKASLDSLTHYLVERICLVAWLAMRLIRLPIDVRSQYGVFMTLGVSCGSIINLLSAPDQACLLVSTSSQGGQTS